LAFDGLPTLGGRLADQFRDVSTSLFLLIQGIMARRRAPTSARMVFTDYNYWESLKERGWARPSAARRGRQRSLGPPSSMRTCFASRARV
jgi:hypothetical protein